MNGRFDLIITGGEVVLQMQLRSGGREHGFEQYLEKLQLIFIVLTFCLTLCTCRASGGGIEYAVDASASPVSGCTLTARSEAALNNMLLSKGRDVRICV